jgi:hypothetical protein
MKDVLDALLKMEETMETLEGEATATLAEIRRTISETRKKIRDA